MSILCCVGLHRWKIVQRYVREGFNSAAWGIPFRSYHEYKGERCVECKKWRKEGAMHWYQWLGLLMVFGPIVGAMYLAGGWVFLGLVALSLLVFSVMIAGIFLMC